MLPLEKFKSIAVPVTVLAGATSPGRMQDVAKGLAGVIPGRKLEIMPGLGYMVPAEVIPEMLRANYRPIMARRFRTDIPWGRCWLMKPRGG